MAVRERRHEAVLQPRRGSRDRRRSGRRPRRRRRARRQPGHLRDCRHRGEQQDQRQRPADAVRRRGAARVRDAALRAHRRLPGPEPVRSALPASRRRRAANESPRRGERDHRLVGPGHRADRSSTRRRHGLVAGAEDDVYSSFPDPYRIKNAPFDSLDELRLVRGVGDDFWSTFVEPNPTIPTRARSRSTARDG